MHVDSCSILCEATPYAEVQSLKLQHTCQPSWGVDQTADVESMVDHAAQGTLTLLQGCRWLSLRTLLCRPVPLLK